MVFELHGQNTSIKEREARENDGDIALLVFLTSKVVKADRLRRLRMYQFPKDLANF